MDCGGAYFLVNSTRAKGVELLDIIGTIIGFHSTISKTDTNWRGLRGPDNANRFGIQEFPHCRFE